MHLILAQAISLPCPEVEEIHHAANVCSLATLSGSLGNEEIVPTQRFIQSK